MAQVEFKYKGISTIIKCKENEIMKNIIEKFIQKAGIDEKNNIYFLYGGEADIKTKENLTFSEVANSVDKNQKKMTILVNDSNSKGKEVTSVKKSNYIICPKCGERAKIKINNFKISLYGCKNGHKIDDLSLDEFNEKQYIDLSEIKCSKCKETKSNTFNNIFYKCSECNINLCPLCKGKHKHNVINYDQINNKCICHSREYEKICYTCKEKICSTCEYENHKNHEISINLTDKEDLKIELHKLRDYIDNININIYEIIDRLNIIKENLEKYYEFEREMINNYKYFDLFNLNEIINFNNIIKDINNKNISQMFENLMDFYKKMKIGNQIKLTLKIIKLYVNKNIYFLDNTDGSIYIDNESEEHHHDFLKELNESNVDLFINNKKYKFQKYFKPDKEGIYSIIIKLKNNITDCSCMFYNCNNIVNIDLSSFNSKNVIDMKNMFFCCTGLTNIDLSSFNTQNVIDMSYMFYGCSLLKSLDLSSFNTKNTKSLQDMFSCCNNLIELDLSSFNTEHVTNISFMFDSCNNLENINLSTFNTENVTNMRCTFYNCININNINLSSSFTLKKVTDKSYMFENCSNLKNIDLSHFEDKNIIIMKNKNDSNISLLNNSKNSNTNNRNNQIKHDSSLYTNYYSKGKKDYDEKCLCF